MLTQENSEVEVRALEPLVLSDGSEPGRRHPQCRTSIRTVLGFCTVLFVILLGVGLLSSKTDPGASVGGGSPEPHGCTLEDTSYDYFELVLQWPPAFGTSLGNKVDHWTIHGLWPSRVQHPQTYPCECTKEAFNEQEVTSLMPLMRKYWPSFKSNDYASFWSHEWEKHGTCCRPHIKTQFQYFNTTLDLRLQVDPGRMLKKLKPSLEQGYTFVELYDALAAEGDVGLHCAHRNDRQVLTEVDFCMTASPRPKRFPCPKVSIDGASSRCDAYRPIYILPANLPSKKMRLL